MRPRRLAAMLVWSLLPACGGGSSADKRGDSGADGAAGAGDSPPAPAPAQRKVGRGRIVASPPAFPTQDFQLGALDGETMVAEHVHSEAGQRAAWRTGDGEAFLDGVPLTDARGGHAMRFSANGQYFAYVSGSDPQQHHVIVGEVVFGPYSHVNLLAIDDEGHVQFLAGPPDQRVLFRDDVAGPSFTKIAKLDLVRAQPEGPVLAYRASTAEQQCVVIGGAKTCHRMVGRPVLSANASKAAYAATDAIGHSFVVVDGERKPSEHRHIDWRLWLGNDGRLAYVAQQADGKRAVVIDGVAGKPYDRVAKLSASADGKTIGYSVKDGAAWRVVTQTRAHADVGGEIKTLELAPTGGRWAAVAAGERGIRVVTAEGRGPWFSDVRWLRFSDDGKHLAYVGEREDGGSVVVVDGTASEAYSQLGDPRFLADGGVAFVAERDGAWSLVAGEHRWGPYDDIGVAGAITGVSDSNYTLSEDGRHVVFAGRKGAMWHAVVDGVDGPPHAEIWSAPFSFEASGARVGYVAREATGVVWRMRPLSAPAGSAHRDTPAKPAPGRKPVQASAP